MDNRRGRTQHPATYPMSNTASTNKNEPTHTPMMQVE